MSEVKLRRYESSEGKENKTKLPDSIFLLISLTKSELLIFNPQVDLAFTR